MVSFFNDLFDLLKNLEGTPLEFIIPSVIILAVGYSIGKWVIAPCWKLISTWWSKKRFSAHESLSFMQAADVYYAIDHFIPTRYTRRDPAQDDEPIPEYMGVEGSREPLLLDHFLKYEFDKKLGGKFCLCLGDCGMGKTTFLINLFYAARKKKHKYSCEFVSLVYSDCLEKIKAIPDKNRTVLLLDALDESDAAIRDFGQFMTDLEDEVRDFYRVVITSRTNFFSNAEKEKLFTRKNGASTTEKISSAHKYYIAPLTDEDIQHYLHRRYRGKAYKKAWSLVDANKNLSVRPLMLRYMDDMIHDDIHFSHNFELYEYLFRQWIARETGKTTVAQDALYKECLILAKAMYYQWMKDGRIGIYPDEIDESTAIPGLAGIRFLGHAILNRTSDGMYKFAHRSYWEYLISRLALSDIVFSDDLYIRNFDQAETFLKEMIQVNESDESCHVEFDKTDALLGTANYYLKYWRPEEAEKLLRNVLKDESALTESQYLFTQIHLIRSFNRQWKEASAERILLPMLDRLNNTELTAELVPHFTQFGNELAVYSRLHVNGFGQAFLMDIINFCVKWNVPGYYLFECFEMYCHCALNYTAKDNALLEMERQITEQIGEKKDEYIEYLLNSASSWKLSYKDPNCINYLNTILVKHERFLDSYQAIIDRGDLAHGIMAVYADTREGAYEQVENTAIECLGEAYDICCEIYSDDEHEVLHNPYITFLSDKLVVYFSINPYASDKIIAEITRLIDYRSFAHLEEEMKIRYCRILERAGNNKSLDFAQREKYLLEYLAFARSIQCSSEEIGALWDIYVLYYNKGDAPADGQEQLRAAYDIACGEHDYKETPSYCKLLQVVIDFYNDNGEIDKEALYCELRDIAPSIYGRDKRRSRIYRCLRDYATNIGDPAAVDFAFEVLRCEFDRFALETCYKTCKNSSNEERFISELETILREMPELTSKQENVIESFLTYETNSASEITVPSLEELFDEGETGQVVTRSTPTSDKKPERKDKYSPEFSQKVRSTVKRVKKEKQYARFGLNRRSAIRS